MVKIVENINSTDKCSFTALTHDLTQGSEIDEEFYTYTFTDLTTTKITLRCSLSQIHEDKVAMRISRLVAAREIDLTDGLLNLPILIHDEDALLPFGVFTAETANQQTPYLNLVYTDAQSMLLALVTFLNVELINPYSFIEMDSNSSIISEFRANAEHTMMRPLTSLFMCA